MIKTKKNKSIFKRILAFCGAGICAIACCFTIFNISKKNNVYADSVDISYSFQGSNFIVPVLMEGRGDCAYRTNIQFANLRFNFNIDLNNGLVKFFGFSQSLPDGFQGSTDRFGSYSTGGDNYVNVSMNNIYHRSSIWWGLSNDTINTLITPIWFKIDPSFIANIKSIQFGSYRSGSLQDIDFCTYYNYVRYVDINNKFLTIVIEGFSDDYDFDDRFFLYTFLDNRTYYIVDPSNFTDNEIYNAGYNTGLGTGYDNGYTAGENEGYSRGYNVGNNVGYNNGYNKGINESNDYTFLGLVSACIDAPITYFTSLFNFELLGVNLSSFLTALFTICVIVTIVKLCLGR